MFGLMMYLKPDLTNDLNVKPNYVDVSEKDESVVSSSRQSEQ